MQEIHIVVKMLLKPKMFGDITKLNGDDLLKEAGIKKRTLFR